MIFFHAKISKDRSVDLLFPGILHPHIKICLDIHPTHTVQGYDIKFPDRLIIFRRVSRCSDQPSLRYAVASERLILKKLQHGRRSVSETQLISSINRTPSFFPVRSIQSYTEAMISLKVYSVILTSFSVIAPGHDPGQSYRTLSCMVGDGIGYQPYSAFLCHPAP